MDNPMKSRILTVTFWLVLPLSAFVVMSQNFSELESPGAMAADNRCDRFIQTAEDLWMQNNFEGSDAALQKARGICPERAEIYWRLARNGYNRLEDIPRDQKPAPRKLFEIYGRLERQADKCIAVDPQDGNCCLWKALCLGNRMMYQSNIKNIPLVAGLEATIKRGLELRPAYRSANGASDSLGDLYSMLGAFYRILPEWLCAFPFKQIVGTCGDLNQAVAFGSPRKRAQQTSAYAMAGKSLDTITGSESLEELKEKIDKDLKVGSKIGSDPRLDFYLDKNCSPAILWNYLEGKLL